MEVNKLLKKALAKVSLFWRFFILLSLVTALFLITLSVSSRQFSSNLQEAYLDQAEENFRHNCQSFSREMFLAYSLPPAVENRAAYSDAASAVSQTGTQSIFAFNEVRESFVQQCALLRLPSESFLYFSRSGLCLFRNHMTQPAEQCFGTYLIYEDDLLTTTLYENDLPTLGLCLLPAKQVSINGDIPRQYLTLLVPSSTRTEIYGFLYSAESVLEHFQLNSLPEDTALRFVDANGQTMFSHGPEAINDSRYIRLSGQLPSLSCTAEISIPRSYFSETLQESHATSLALFFACLIMGVAMCFIFSHMSVKPFRDLIRHHAGDRTPDAPENELVAIDSFLKTARQDNSALRGMLLSSLLARSLAGQPVRQDEYQSLSLAFPQFQQPQRTAVVRDRRSEPSTGEDASPFTVLSQALPQQFLCEYINLQEVLVLFPANAEDFDLFQDTLLQLNAGLERGPRFVCGVSAPFLGIGEIDSSIRQAQFCLPEDSERVVVAFSQDVVASDTDTPSFDLKQFQHALATWQHRETLAMLNHLCAHPGNHPEEVFYSILFLLRDTAQSSKMSFASCEKTTYLQTGTPAANFAQLREVVDDLFRQKSDLQLSDRQVLCQQIVEHIKANFSDPTFCLFALSKQFGVSERFAHNAIQSITGMNFSGFLAMTRTQEAARLLRETELSIQEVAEYCGYPAISTFYRNFKKQYLMTPAEYKDSIQ